MEAHHGGNRFRHRRDAAGEGMAPTQPCPPLLVGDLLHARILAAPHRDRAGCSGTMTG